MGHRVGDEARRRIGVAIAALDAGDRDMRRRGVAGCDRPVVAARTIGIARLVGVDGTGPAGEGCGRAGMAGDAVASRRRHVAGIRGRSQRALGAFADVRAVVAGVAARRAHRRVVHRVGDETGRRIGVATAALDAGDRDMRRRGQAQRQRVVVAARAIGVARSVDVFCPRPAGEAAGRAGMTGDAVASVGRHVIEIRRRAQRAVAALPCVRAVVASVAADRAHRRMVHHVSREARRRIRVTIAALNRR